MRPSLFATGQNLLRAAHETEQREDLGDGKSMMLLRARAHGVLDENKLISEFVRGPGCRFDPVVGGNATEDDLAHAATAQLKVEFRTVKRAPLTLRDEKIARLRSEFRHDLGPISRTITAGHGKIGFDLYDIRKVRGKVDVNENDGSFGPAEALGQLGRLANHLGSGMGRERDADNALLEIDEDEGGVSEVDFGRVHVLRE